VTSLPSLAYFFAGWPFAALAVHFSDRDDAYLAFALVAGPLFAMAGARLLKDPSDPWLGILRILDGWMPSGLPPDGLAFRVFPGAVLLVIGAAFFGAGVVGSVDLITT
jgi:hypothetical protein